MSRTYHHRKRSTKPTRKADWSKSSTINVMKSTEGGMGQNYAMFLLRDANIPCKPATSIYLGHTAVMVPLGYMNRASRLLLR